MDSWSYMGMNCSVSDSPGTRNFPCSPRSYRYKKLAQILQLPPHLRLSFDKKEEGRTASPISTTISLACLNLERGFNKHHNIIVFHLHHFTVSAGKIEKLAAPNHHWRSGRSASEITFPHVTLLPSTDPGITQRIKAFDVNNGTKLGKQIH